MHIFHFSATTLALFSLISMLILATESAPTYSAHYLKNKTFYQPNTKFQSNLNTLLSSLTSNSSINSNNGFYRTTMGQDTPNTIHGLLLCCGEVIATVCHGCIVTTATNLTCLYHNDKQAIISYDTSMLRYSDKTFNNLIPGIPLNDKQLSKLLNDLAANSAVSSEKKFAAGDVGLASSQTLYGMTQCVPELTSTECDSAFKVL